VESFFHNSRTNSINQHGRRSLVIHDIDVDVLNGHGHGTVSKENLMVSHDIHKREKESLSERDQGGGVSVPLQSLVMAATVA